MEYCGARIIVRWVTHRGIVCDGKRYWTKLLVPYIGKRVYVHTTGGKSFVDVYNMDGMLICRPLEVCWTHRTDDTLDALSYATQAIFGKNHSNQKVENLSRPPLDHVDIDTLVRLAADLRQCAELIEALADDGDLDRIGVDKPSRWIYERTLTKMHEAWRHYIAARGDEK